MKNFCTIWNGLFCKEMCWNLLTYSTWGATSSSAGHGFGTASPPGSPHSPSAPHYEHTQSPVHIHTHVDTHTHMWTHTHTPSVVSHGQQVPPANGFTYYLLRDERQCAVSLCSPLDFASEAKHFISLHQLTFKRKQEFSFLALCRRGSTPADREA